MYLINGQNQDCLDVRDRGIQFGDGCFTTARIINGEVRFLHDHLVRLRRDARRLRITPPDWKLLQTEMISLAAGIERGVLKVMLTRGPGGRGYSAANCRQTSRILSLASWPAHYDALRASGLRLVSSPVRLGSNIQLAGIKHLNRLEQVMIRMHLDQTECDEALVLDSAGMLVECCAANLLWRKGTQIYTPALQHSGVEGTMRRHILRLLHAAGRTVNVVRAKPEELMQADEVLACNALMPVLAVREIDGQHFGGRDLFNFLSPRCE